MLLKRQCISRTARNLAARILPIPGHYDPVGFDYLPIFAPHPVIFALGRTHAEPVRSPFTKIYLAKGKREVVRAPPSDEMLRPGPCVEHDLTRSIKDSPDDKLAIARGRRRIYCRRHVLLSAEFRG